MADLTSGVQHLFQGLPTNSTLQRPRRWRYGAWPTRCVNTRTLCAKKLKTHIVVWITSFSVPNHHIKASKHLWIEHYLFSCQHILLMSQAMKCWLKYWAAQLQSTKKRICCLWCVHCFVYFWIADLLDTFSQFFRWCEHREMLIVFTY